MFCILHRLLTMSVPDVILDARVEHINIGIYVLPLQTSLTNDKVEYRAWDCQSCRMISIFAYIYCQILAITSNYQYSLLY